MDISEKLDKIEKIVGGELPTSGVVRILELMGIAGLPLETLSELKLYSEYLPAVSQLGFTNKQRYLHFLWDLLDKSPMCLTVNFSIPFRRIIAKQLFKKCGKNFIAEENVRFNFGQNIEIGDNAFFNRGVFLDSKGGITIGNSVGFGEGVHVFTHGHSESNHAERSYKPVIIEDYAEVYSHSTVLPGVTIGKEAIVAARSLVAKDVEPGMVVSGVPAVPVRARKTDGKSGNELNHIWLAQGAFQEEP